MNHDLLGPRAAELATQLGVRAPKVKSTRLLPKCWFPEGILAYALFLWPVVVLTPAFDGYSRAEQDALLAHWLVQAELSRTTLPKFLGAALLFTVQTYVPINIRVGLGDSLFFYYTYNGWLVNGVELPHEMFWLAYSAWLGALVMAAFVWGRRIVYRADRQVAVVLGRHMANHILDVARRIRYQRRGLVGMYLNLLIPSEAKRADANSCFEPIPVGL
ncbi:hypothetical protein [Streptomyces roseolus]|uniref:hypothetical protein n=1 Tax=Streptomyces roseolus TaxID=67358 RepID=UPI00365CA06B